MFFQVKNYATLQEALDGLCTDLATRKLDQERIFDCKLVACELLSNVLKHGDGKAELLAELQDGCVVLRVLSNTVFQLPKQISCSDLFAENGRGLFLVNTLCEGEIFTEDNAIVAKIKIER